MRALAFVALLACASARAEAPSFADVKASFTTSEAILLDRHGTPLSEIRADTHARRLDWVALEDISTALAATLVAA